MPATWCTVRLPARFGGSESLSAVRADLCSCSLAEIGAHVEAFSAGSRVEVMTMVNRCEGDSTPLAVNWWKEGLLILGGFSGCSPFYIFCHRRLSLHVKLDWTIVLRYTVNACMLYCSALSNIASQLTRRFFNTC